MFFESSFLIIISIAILLDIILPIKHYIFNTIIHPVVLIGKTISFLEKNLNKGNKYLQFINGFITTIIVIIVFTLPIILITDYIHTPYVFYFEFIFAIILIASGQLYNTVKLLMIRLDKNNLEKSKELIPHLCSRETKNITKTQMSSAGIESLLENFCDGIIAPALFFIIAGLPGIVFYKVINTLDSMIGYKTTRYFYFGKFSARLDDVVNFIPSYITLLLLIFTTGFTKKTSLQKGLNQLFSKQNYKTYNNANHAEAFIAGALNIKLGGKKIYNNKPVENWIGDGRENISTMDMSIALSIFKKANIWFALITILIYFLLFQ